MAPTKSSGVSISTVLAGVGATIGILLLLLSASICVLAIVLVFNRRNKKSVSWSPNQSRPIPDLPVSSNYQIPPLDQYHGQMTDSVNSRPNDICNGSFELLAMANTPQVPPPTDSGLISIDEWRRKVEMEQMDNEEGMNPLYAGSMCGSEYGEPPQYETVSEAKKAFKQKEVNMLRLAQLRQASLAHGSLGSTERLNTMECSVAGSTQNINAQLTQAASHHTQVHGSRELELDLSDSSGVQDEGDVSNCFYEATAGVQADKNEQVNTAHGSIYELDEDSESCGTQTSNNNTAILENTPCSNNEIRIVDAEHRSMAQSHHSSESSSIASSLPIRQYEATSVLEQENDPTIGRETQSNGSDVEDPHPTTEEVMFVESVYDNPSCLDNIKSKSSISLTSD